MLTGELLGDRDQVISALAEMFKKEEHQIEKLISSAPIAIKKKVAREVAEKYQRAIEAKGAIVKLEPLSPEKKPMHTSWSLEPTEEELEQQDNQTAQSTEPAPLTGKANFAVKDIEQEQALTEPKQRTPDVEADNYYATPESEIVTEDRVAGQMSLRDVYFSFDGRINRSTFWLKYFLPSIGLFIVFGILFAIAPTFMSILALPISIALIWISIAVSIKRLHDIDFVGWWYLLNFIPGGGLAVLIMNGFIPGTPGSNRFGYPEE